MIEHDKPYFEVLPAKVPADEITFSHLHRALAYWGPLYGLIPFTEPNTLIVDTLDYDYIRKQIAINAKE